MATLGQELRTEREKHSLSLKDISDRTKVGLRYLVALEEDRWEEMPKFFIRSIIKAHAQAMGVDPEPFLARYEEQEKARLESPGTRANLQNEGSAARRPGERAEFSSPPSRSCSSSARPRPDICFSLKPGKIRSAGFFDGDSGPRRPRPPCPSRPRPRNPSPSRPKRASVSSSVSTPIPGCTSRPTASSSWMGSSRPDRRPRSGRKGNSSSRRAMPAASTSP